MNGQPNTVASFAAPKALKVQALKLQKGISTSVEESGSSKRPFGVHETVDEHPKRVIVEGPTGNGVLYPRIQQLELELAEKGNALVGMKLQYQQKATEVRLLTELVTTKESEIAQHLSNMADNSKELDELKATRGSSYFPPPNSFMDIARNIPGFVIESTRSALVCSGIFERQPKEPAFPGMILGQLNPSGCP